MVAYRFLWCDHGGRVVFVAYGSVFGIEAFSTTHYGSDDGRLLPGHLGRQQTFGYVVEPLGNHSAEAKLLLPQLWLSAGSGYPDVLDASLAQPGHEGKQRTLKYY